MNPCSTGLVWTKFGFGPFNYRTNANLFDFQIRCLQLIDPNIDPEMIFQGGIKEEENDEEDDDNVVKMNELINVTDELGRTSSAPNILPTV